MNLLKIRQRERPQENAIRLGRIKRAIETSARFEEEAMSNPLNASTLKRVYNLESLWIFEREGVKRLGSANYSKELELFREVQDRYGGLDSIRIERGAHKYHVVGRGEKTYLFSTPIELTNSDVLMMLNEIERALERKKIFLSSDTNNTGIISNPIGEQ